MAGIFQAPGEPGPGRQPSFVPDRYLVVRGGGGELPAPGTVFSGSAGLTLEDAASGVPHGQVRVTTAAAIRGAGGHVEFVPELTRSGRLNERHVNVMLGPGPSPFGEPIPNPAPRAHRIA